MWLEEVSVLDMGGAAAKIGPYLCGVRLAPTLLLVLFAAAALSFPLSDTDLWWHLAAGRAMIEAGTWLRVDPFCLSSLGTPWIDLHWGFQLLVHAAHALGGDAALVALRTGLVIATVLVALRSRISWSTAALALVLLFSTRTFLDLRPLLVSLLALALLWNLLESPLRIPVVLGALLLQVVLANAQGLFLLGPLFAAAAAVGAWLERDRRRARSLLALAVALLATSLLNPWGPRAFDLARLVASRIVPSATNLFSRQIPENLPLHLWILERPARILPLAWIAFGTSLLWRRGRGAPGRALLLTGTVILSCMAVRNLPLAALAAALCVAPRRIGPRFLLPALAVLLAILLSIPLLLERRWNDPSTLVAPLRLPSERTLALLSRESGPIFHEPRAGGWLSWKLPGRNACWCDTRLVLHDAAFVADFLDIADHPERFESWSRAHDFRFALLPTVELPHWHALAASLLASNSWKLVDADGAWVLFARPESALPALDWSSPDGRRAIERHLQERFSDNPRLQDYVRESFSLLLDEAARRGAGH